MKKFWVSTILILAFGFYVLSQKTGLGSDSGQITPPVGVSLNPTPSGNSNSSGSAPTPTPTPTPTPAPTPKPTPAPVQTSGQYKNGTYVGSVADAFYGNVQVEAIIKNGAIADVQFLQYPSDRSTSRYINSQAMPYLIAQAIQVQSAQVDGVSGASATSGAFQESLASALLQAKL